ncbi:hypothetical protein [Salinicoccus kekensis]|uniref:Uncharacterized protein n=1 Tax=Salinicoccus kekensis TaxID=714307 RepID=A0A285UCH5_9STAP|nr:hypothetical protein [Salinicoccus kekensis]SOC38276.1 hypothetical protein SAMN05878391_0358 [Salinicoccus kekensis]
MNIIANRDGIGASKFELWFFKALHLIMFKKSKHLKNIIHRIEKDIQAIKNKQV